jgi:hypothetical protein
VQVVQHKQQAVPGIAVQIVFFQLSLQQVAVLVATALRKLLTAVTVARVAVAAARVALAVQVRLIKVMQVGLALHHLALAVVVLVKSGQTVPATRVQVTAEMVFK